MMIDKNNYEAYLLDYLEGNLSGEEEARFMQFLSENPDIRSEMPLLKKDLENLTINPDKASFPDKTKLRKNSDQITDDNFQEYCISYYEEELSDNENASFAEYLKANPGKVEDFKIFSRVYLKPDNNIVYPKKSKLKRKHIVAASRINIFKYSAVAGIILLLGLFFLLKDERPTPHAEKVLPGSRVSAENQAPIVNDEHETIHEQDKPILQPQEPLAAKVFTVVNPQDLITETIDYNFSPQRVQWPGRIDPISIEKIYPSNEGLSDYPELYAHLPNNPRSKNNQGYSKKVESTIADLRNYLLPEVAKIEDMNISLYTIAEASVKGLSTITGAEMYLERKFDDDGNVKSTRFNSQNFSFYTSRKIQND